MAIRFEPREIKAESLRPNRCKALTRSGFQCQRNALDGGDFCKTHQVLISVENPQLLARERDLARASNQAPEYVGDDTRYLLPDLQLHNIYAKSLQDPYQLHLRDEIAVIDARTNQLLKLTTKQSKDDPGELDEIDSSTWKRFYKLWRDFCLATDRGDNRRAHEIRQKISDLFSDVISQQSIWTDILTLMDQRRKLVEAEQRHLLEAGRMITAEQALILVGTAIESLRIALGKYVSDKQLVEAVVLDAQHRYSEAVGSE